jgi:hypothetical protein
MPRFVVPTNANLHAVRSFVQANDFFRPHGKTATLELHPKWVHVEPVALSMIAAWGAWARRAGYQIKVRNLGKHADYAARMRLFQHLGVDYTRQVREHEEAGRFLPLTQVRARPDVTNVIANISAMLHMQQDPESLAAVQYCISELLRNVLEHSNSPDGAFVSAHRFAEKGVHRVAIAVADCGQGITSHLSRNHPEASQNDSVALGLAMQPGVTGAVRGPYGTSENAGAGLYITRCIAKGTGGYFFIMSGDAGYRVNRAKKPNDLIVLYPDPYDDERHKRWNFTHTWHGTVVALEIRTEMIADYGGFFQWIFGQIPSRKAVTRRIKFV